MNLWENVYFLTMKYSISVIENELYSFHMQSNNSVLTVVYFQVEVVGRLSAHPCFICWEPLVCV